ncbi:hypothetical protein AMATHDRAFT_146557 [Amanita thiersii Skay4041]|uniref:Major facilitator superfamily (MFS) profile domain-containing protein n=1 Tax=Amanita thiersii Skay4041 TaxID=703135 RepID=A0A2A9NIM1_9AGAR|nr:hypothetical protein AMATHDRAFT_146557 [Amanita thiersii Skay4041]
MSPEELQESSRPQTAKSAATSSTHVSSLKGCPDPTDPASERPTLTAEKLVEIQKIDDEEWENDPANARNWSFGRKWTAVSVVSLYTFIAPLASSMMAPGLPNVADKYHITSNTTIAMTLCIFLLSFALAPLVLAPLSEMYGRKWVLHIGNIFTLAFSLGCGFSPTTSALIGFRFLSGLSASAPIACGGGSISDLFHERDRASAMAVFSLGPLVGPAVGPIAGGFIAQTIGIKWVFIVIAVICGFAAVFGIALLRETYAPVIRKRKLQKETNDPEKAILLEKMLENQRSKLYILGVNLIRPMVILFRSLVCFILSLYMAFMYGIYYLMFATFASFFHDTYGFQAGVGGLAYLGLGLGFLIATFLGAKFADQVYLYLADKNGGVGKPEMRIPALFFGSFFVPIGLFWYGWSAQAKLHWMMPIVGTGFFGFGILPIQLYLVDAFVYAASALAAASASLQVFRSLLGFAFPLFGQQMFDAMGLGGGNSLLGGLAIVLGIPFPVWLYYKGEQIRARNPLTRR